MISRWRSIVLISERVKYKPLLALILLAAVLIRLPVAAYMGDQVTVLPGIHDQLSYDALAGDHPLVARLVQSIVGGALLRNTTKPFFKREARFGKGEYLCLNAKAKSPAPELSANSAAGN